MCRTNLKNIYIIICICVFCIFLGNKAEERNEAIFTLLLCYYICYFVTLFVTLFFICCFICFFILYICYFVIISVALFFICYLERKEERSYLLLYSLFVTLFYIFAIFICYFILYFCRNVLLIYALYLKDQCVLLNLLYRIQKHSFLNQRKKNWNKKKESL